MTTALADKLTGTGARTADYRGARTVAAFTDVAAELDALRNGCGVSDLAWRAKLVITGEDRVRWTNGIVTNNVRDLSPQRGNYNFVLNPQGRIQGDIVIYNRGDYLLGLTDVSQSAKLKELFDRYIIMDDVEITDVSEKLSSIGVTGPVARNILSAAGLLDRTLEPGEVVDLEWQGLGCSVARDILEGLESYEIWLAAENAPRLWDALLAAGASPVGSEALELFRILQGIPRFGQDLGDRELPQETAQAHALHFVKGCYIGQEIVERIRARGNVHRTFGGFEVSGPAPERGSKIIAAGKEVGEVTSSATVPIAGAQHTVALGFIRREAAQPGTPVEIAGTPAKVAALPFQF